MKMPPEYIGREQAFIKHTILKSYLQRLFMIVGRSKETTFNYVDCFAGPWKEEGENLSDTSIAISIRQMVICRQALEKMFERKITFRALFIEKNKDNFSKLSNYLDNNQFLGIETKYLYGDYTKLLDKVIEWKQEYFTFFFVDPTGWKEVVGGSTMSPLLGLPNSEFLINLMYEFINRFVSLEHHQGDMIELFGETPIFDRNDPEERQNILLQMYRNNIQKYYKGRSAYVPVLKPGQNKVLYYLVYLTRNPKGIQVFKEQAEKLEITQRVTQNEIRIRKKSQKTMVDDMFGESSENHNFADNRFEAKQFLLEHLSQTPTLIDLDTWANWLESSNLYPTDIQLAAKELLAENKILNLDADTKARKTKIFVPNWPNKSERWKLKD